MANAAGEPAFPLHRAACLLQDSHREAVASVLFADRCRHLGCRHLGYRRVHLGLGYRRVHLGLGYRRVHLGLGYRRVHLESHQVHLAALYRLHHRRELVGSELYRLRRRPELVGPELYRLRLRRELVGLVSGSGLYRPCL